MAGNRQDDSDGGGAVRFTPPNPLKNAVRNARPGEAGDPVARAEHALAALANEFPAWMRSECARLDATRRAFMASPAEATKADLYLAAHDIKGEAGTFGFPQAAMVADSLCRLLEHSPTLSRIPLTLVDQHVHAVQAIARETATVGAEAMANQLASRLREVADAFLQAENRDRPEILELVMSPSIAPRT